MGSTESPTLTRSQLYELIWTTPRRRLAQQYGLSDVGLSKLCRRHDVPQPPRGYWAKLAVGKAPPRARLPHPERDPPIDLRSLTAAESARREKYQRDRDERKAWAERLEPVAVPERMNRPHPLVKATQAFFAAIPGQLKRDARRSGLPYYQPREAPPSDNGRYWCLDGSALPIKVSPAQADRALRILDVLLKRLEASGFAASIRKPDPRASPRDVRLRVSRNKEACAIELVEGYSRIRLTDEELAQLRKTDPYASPGAQANGRLTFTVTGIDFGGSLSWRDSPSIPLEDRLADIIATVIDLNPQQAALREQKRRDDEARERREAEERRQKALADQRDDEFRAVLGEARIARELASLNGYLDRLEAEFPQAGDPQRLWFKTMRTLARLLDPFEDRVIAIEDLGMAGAQPLEWLRQIDDAKGFLTALIDENPFNAKSTGAGYWHRYHLVRNGGDSQEGKEQVQQQQSDGIALPPLGGI